MRSIDSYFGAAYDRWLEPKEPDFYPCDIVASATDEDIYEFVMDYAWDRLRNYIEDDVPEAIFGKDDVMKEYVDALWEQGDQELMSTISDLMDDAELQSLYCEINGFYDRG